jgi:hypothetical protein
MKRKTLGVGSVSTATMRNEDLIPSFVWECNHIRLTRAERAKVRDIEKRMRAPDYYDSEDSDCDLNEDLFDILGNHCPPFCWFGAHEGDGCDFGVWFSSESFEDACQQGEVLKVADLANVPRGHSGMVAQVSDHGNLELYRAVNGRLYSVLSLV